MIDERIAKLAPTFFICPMCGERVEWNHGTLDSCTADDPFVHTCADDRVVKVFLDRKNEVIRFDAGKFCDADYGGYSDGDLVFAGSEAGVPMLKFFKVGYRKYEWCAKNCKQFRNCRFEKEFICDDVYCGFFGTAELSVLEWVFKLEFETTEYQKARDEWFKSCWSVRENKNLAECIAKVTPKSIWNHKTGSWDGWSGGLIEFYGLGKKGAFGKQKVELLFHKDRRLDEDEYLSHPEKLPASVEAPLCPMLSNSVVKLDKLFFESESNTPILEFSLDHFGEDVACKKCGHYEFCQMRCYGIEEQVETKQTFFGTSLKIKLRLDWQEYRKLRKEFERKF